MDRLRAYNQELAENPSADALIASYFRSQNWWAATPTSEQPDQPIEIWESDLPEFTE